MHDLNTLNYLAVMTLILSKSTPAGSIAAAGRVMLDGIGEGKSDESH